MVCSYSAERAEGPPAARPRGVVAPHRRAGMGDLDGAGGWKSGRRGTYVSLRKKRQVLRGPWGSARAADKPSRGPAAMGGSKRAQLM